MQPLPHPVSPTGNAKLRFPAVVRTLLTARGTMWEEIYPHFPTMWVEIYPEKKYFTKELEALFQDQKQGTLPGGLDDYHQFMVSTWEKRIPQLRDEKWGRSKQ
ncbi:MAG: hypothetical protein K1Y36_30265 [Blastocatellia bacterium]|nr:hypothetical protein [Blastocatellia bacterium]